MRSRSPLLAALLLLSAACPAAPAGPDASAPPGEDAAPGPADAAAPDPDASSPGLDATAPGADSAGAAPDAACRPDCSGRLCGPDGCGGACGACPARQGCIDSLGLCACLPGEDCATGPANGDVLLVSATPGDGFGAHVVPGSAACLRAMVLHQDGSLDPVSFTPGAFRVEVSDPAIVTTTQWDDCREQTQGAEFGGPGVLGLGPGTARATLVWTRSDGTLRSALAVKVHDYRLDLELMLTGQQPVGMTQLITGAIRAFDGATRVDWHWGNWPFVPPSSLVPSLAPAGLAEVVRYDDKPHWGWGLLLRGLATGDLTAALRYGPNASQITNSVAVKVVEAGALTSVDSVGYQLEPSAASPTGYCYRASATGTFTPTSGTPYSGTVLSGLTWTALDTGLTLDDPGARALFCPTSEAETEVKACAGAMCATGVVAHFGAVDGFEIVPGAASAAGTKDSTGMLYKACFPIRSRLVLPKATAHDVTTSRAITYFQEPNPHGMLRPSLGADGRIEANASGDPCFELALDSMCPTVAELTIDLYEQYLAPLPSYLYAVPVKLTTTGIVRPPTCP